MAITDPQDTLAYHLSRPLSAARDMGGVRVPLVAKAMKAWLNEDEESGTVPETEALWFYSLNHGMAHIRKARALYEPLGELLPFVQEYYRRLSPKAVRAFYYLMLICTREARHLQNTPGLDKIVIQQHGPVAWEWAQGAKGEHAAHDKLLNSPPNMVMRDYVGALRTLFYEGKWAGGYGGKAWGQVTDCLVRFVNGEFNAEMMLDTVWTLAHNNGPIFNKGHCYGGYTHAIYKVLDVQASGQMIEMVLHDKSIGEFKKPEMIDLAVWVREHFPDAVGKFVDWYLVEALGSKHKYAAEKMAQAKLHGVPEGAAAAEKAAHAKAAAEVEKAAKAALAAKQKALLTTFEVMPGLTVKKLSRAALAA